MDSASKVQMTIRSHGHVAICKYPAKQHAQRVAAKLDAKKTLILLQGEKSALYSNSDMPRPFRQDRYFYYMTGCNEPGCYVTYDAEQDKLILWLPPVDLKQFYYDGRGSTTEEAMERYDIDQAIYISSPKTMIGATENLSCYVKAYGSIIDWSYLKPDLDVLPELIEQRVGHRSDLLLRKALDACRVVKDHHEIELIRKANDVSATAHIKILKQLHALKSEPEIEGLFVGTCLSHKAKQQSYGPICGSGPNASQLHYVDNDQDFRDRQVLLVDAGAEWQDYASDVTRTMPINPKNPGYWQTKEAEAIYKEVEKIQESSIARLRAGERFIDIHYRSVRMAIESLLDLGILKGEFQEILQAGTILAFYPHGLGHHIGLEAHDVPPPSLRETNYLKWLQSLPHLSEEKHNPVKLEHYSIDPTQCHSPCRASSPSLEAGMVVTIEPGIYFNKFILDAVLEDSKHSKFIDRDVLERYMHVGGVRIEDDLLITENGCENLTTVPKGDEMLKVIREGGKEAKCP